VLYEQYQIPFQENQLKHEDKVIFDKEVKNGSNTFLSNIFNLQSTFCFSFSKYTKKKSEIIIIIGIGTETISE
jgi:hypothetical protein